MIVVAGQRPKHTSTQRSWRIVDALTRLLGGYSCDRNVPLMHPYGCDLYMQWGYRLTPALQSAVDSLTPFCIVDGGFFEDRDRYISLSFNGFQDLADKIEPASKDPRPHPYPEKWSTGGDLIIVYGQVPGDRSLRGLDHQAWVEETLEALEAKYPDHQVGFRPHPKSQKPSLTLPHMSVAYGRLHLAVTYTSTAAVQTVVAGIPTVAMHPASTSAPVTSRDLSRVRFPGRRAWLHGLSHRQYADTELELAADYIRHAFPQTIETAHRGAYDLEGISP